MVADKSPSQIDPRKNSRRNQCALLGSRRPRSGPLRGRDRAVRKLPLKLRRHQKNIAVVHLRGQALVNEPARNALAQSIHAAQASILVVVVTDPLRAQVAQNRPPQSGPKTFGLAAVGDVRCTNPFF